MYSCKIDGVKFYSYHNLQGSQTNSLIECTNKQFYSYHNLQGSQTLMCILMTFHTVLLLS